jgi:MFS transporter, PPP family, 3-phenylpropionic acid transporter
MFGCTWIRHQRVCSGSVHRNDTSLSLEPRSGTPAARLSPALRGSLYYLGYWGIVGVYAPFINVYFVRLGLSGREIGVLSTLLPLMTLLVAPPLAALADRRGWRVRVLALSIALLALCLLLLGLPRTFVTLAPLMALLALGRAPIAAIGDSLVARMAARHRLDYGRLRLWGSLSFSAVAIGCGALWERIGFGPMFAIAGVLFIPVVASALLLEEGRPLNRQVRVSPAVLWRDTGLVAILLASFLIGSSFGIDIIFSGIFMDALGGGEMLIGAALGVGAFSELPSMRYGEAITRRLRGPTTLVLSYLLLGLGLAGTSLALAPWVLLLMSMVKGFGFGLFFVSTVRLLDERAPEAWSSTVQALMNAGAWGLAPLLTNPVGGVIYDLWGVRAVFASATVATVLAAAVIVVASRRGAFDRPVEHPGEPEVTP